MENNQQFQKKLFPLVIDGIISGKSVLVVHNNSNLGGKAAKLTSIFKLAGSRQIAVKSIDSLPKGIKLDSYNYLIYLGSKEEFSDKGLKKKYSNNFKKIKHLSTDI